MYKVCYRENLDLPGSTLLDNIAAAVVHFYPSSRASFYPPPTMFEKDIFAADMKLHMRVIIQFDGQKIVHLHYHPLKINEG